MDGDDVSEIERDERREALGSLQLAIAGMTHCGRIRQINQDAFGRFDDHERGEILLVVADGLGGHRGGEVASRIAASALGRVVRETEGEADVRLVSAVRRANRVVFEAASRDPALKGMGTTIVALLLRADGPCYVAHAGDSRLYRIRGPAIESLTEDHSVVALMVREGLIAPEEAREHPKRNQIIRALGVRDEIEVDVAPLEIQPGDAYLLCSDGLYGMLPDADLMRLEGSAPHVDTAVAWMVDAANQAGGTDNITALLVRVLPPSPLPSQRDRTGRLMTRLRALLENLRWR